MKPIIISGLLILIGFILMASVVNKDLPSWLRIISFITAVICFFIGIMTKENLDREERKKRLEKDVEEILKK